MQPPETGGIVQDLQFHSLTQQLLSISNALCVVSAPVSEWERRCRCREEHRATQSPRRILHSRGFWNSRCLGGHRCSPQPAPGAIPRGAACLVAPAQSFPWAGSTWSAPWLLRDTCSCCPAVGHVQPACVPPTEADKRANHSGRGGGLCGERPGGVGSRCEAEGEQGSRASTCTTNTFMLINFSITKQCTFFRH